MFRIRLKELRKQNGHSQKSFANLFNISNGAVGNWESGKRMPDTEMLTKLADFFNVSIDYLLGRTDDPSPHASIDEKLSGLDFALYGEVKSLNDAEKEKILEFIKFTKTQRK